MNLKKFLVCRLVAGVGISLCYAACGSWAVNDLRGFVVTPPALTLRPGQQGRFTSLLVLADKKAAELPDLCAWSVDDPNVVLVQGNVVSALAPGSATMTAIYDGLHAHAAITVSHPVQAGRGLDQEH